MVHQVSPPGASGVTRKQLAERVEIELVESDSPGRVAA